MGKAKSTVANSVLCCDNSAMLRPPVARSERFVPPGGCTWRNKVPLLSVTRAKARERLLKGGGATHYSGRAAASGRVADWMQKVHIRTCHVLELLAATKGFADGFQYPFVLARNLDLSCGYEYAARNYLHRQCHGGAIRELGEPCPRRFCHGGAWMP